MARLSTTYIDGRLTATNQIISLVAAGTPPFIVSSSTVIPNLNVNYLNGST